MKIRKRNNNDNADQRWAVQWAAFSFKNLRVIFLSSQNWWLKNELSAELVTHLLQKSLCSPEFLCWKIFFYDLKNRSSINALKGTFLVLNWVLNLCKMDLEIMNNNANVSIGLPMSLLQKSNKPLISAPLILFRSLFNCAFQ